MKITKDPIDARNERDAYEEAHDGCYKCPYCLDAEVRAFEEQLRTEHGYIQQYDNILCVDREFYRLLPDGTIDRTVQNLSPAIEKYDTVTITKGRPKSKRYKVFLVDKYRCRLCGAEWESNPYAQPDEAEIKRRQSMRQMYWRQKHQKKYEVVFDDGSKWSGYSLENNL